MTWLAHHYAFTILYVLLALTIVALGKWWF